MSGWIVVLSTGRFS